jgi:hypothetical protein
VPCLSTVLLMLAAANGGVDSASIVDVRADATMVLLEPLRSTGPL